MAEKRKVIDSSSMAGKDDSAPTKKQNIKASYTNSLGGKMAILTKF